MSRTSFVAWWLLGSAFTVVVLVAVGHLADGEVGTCLLFPGVLLAQALSLGRFGVIYLGVPITGLLCPLIVWLLGRRPSSTSKRA